MEHDFNNARASLEQTGVRLTQPGQEALNRLRLIILSPEVVRETPSGERHRLLRVSSVGPTDSRHIGA